MEQFYGWIRKTRALMVEFTLYNPNANLFSVFSLMLEYPASSGTLSYTRVQVSGTQISHLIQ